MTFTFPDMASKIGVFPLRISVRGDGSYAYSKLAVIPKRSKCVVFSIDGSFAASGPWFYIVLISFNSTLLNILWVLNIFFKWLIKTIL